MKQPKTCSWCNDIGHWKKRFCSHECYWKWLKGKTVTPQNVFKKGHLLGKRFPKGHIPWIKGKHGITADEKNPSWKGDAVGYNALHNWFRRKYGKADHCESCYEQGKPRYHWANKSGQYLRDREDWLQMCPSCHYRYDQIHVKTHKYTDFTRTVGEEKPRLTKTVIKLMKSC